MKILRETKEEGKKSYLYVYKKRRDGTGVGVGGRVEQKAEKNIARSFSFQLVGNTVKSD